jgi:SOS-response transcriptional repressor LexA
MDPVRALVLRKAEELGGLKRLSVELGRNHAYLQQFIHRGVPATLDEHVRARLAGLLGVDEAALKLPADIAPRPAPLEPRPRGNVGGHTPMPMAGSVPIFGVARGGEDGKFVLNGNKIADILAPPKLASVPDAYAVYVVGDSMEPRYFSGEALFVHPRLPVRQGDFVVAQIAADEGEPPEAYVKRFISLDDKLLRLEQFNPRKIMKFPARRVVSLHRIIMAGDG